MEDDFDQSHRGKNENSMYGETKRSSLDLQDFAVWL